MGGWRGPWRTGGAESVGRGARACGLLLVFALVRLVSAGSRESSEEKLRTQATSSGAETRRAVEVRKVTYALDYHRAHGRQPAAAHACAPSDGPAAHAPHRDRL
ncbi:hypothetical protein [Streptomyces caniferus]|uniref:hypothetical protein n=1 Tax=Streptomyces caniferus TaxID=285557 RepID=UPI0037F6F980